MLQPWCRPIVLRAGNLPLLLVAQREGGCVEGLRLLQTVWELLFSTKQALQSSGKSPNAKPRCLTAADHEGALCCRLSMEEWSSRATID